ncbi:MAG TPA: hypothetical protein VF549_07395 [Solirubrobacteraceae bacterium]
MTFPRRRALAHALSLAALLLALLPAAALANANVTRTEAQILVQDDDVLANVISITDGPGTDVLIHDDSAEVFALSGEGCTQEDPKTARCATAPKVVLELGDGGDTLVAGSNELPRDADGQAGDDHLFGGAGDDLFRAGEGDDEFGGGDGRDRLSYETSEAPVDVTMPAPGAPTATGQGETGENDKIHSDIEDLVGGKVGDHLVPQRLGSVDAGPGDDVVESENGVAESLVDCGGGSGDKVDADNVYDHPQNCETVAPDIEGTPVLDNTSPVVGGQTNVSLPNLSGDAPEGSEGLRIEWYRCDGTTCELVQSGNVGTYFFATPDVGRTVFARLVVQNSAGGDSADSAQTAPVADAPVLQLPPPPPPPVFPPPGFPPGGYGDYGDYADYGDYGDLLELEDAIAAWARRLLQQVLANTHDPRKLARRRVIPHPFVYPYDGTVTMTWGVRPPTRKARAAAARSLVIAKGSRKGKKGQKRTVSVRLTKRGRAILRRAKRLKVTLKITFVGGPLATKSSPVTVRRSFVLKRRRA